MNFFHKALRTSMLIVSLGSYSCSDQAPLRGSPASDNHSANASIKATTTPSTDESLDPSSILPETLELTKNDGTATTTPDPSQVRIKSVHYAGTGCPADTVASNISTDAKALTLLFAEFVAEAGPDASPAAARRHCRITLDLQFPSGYSYTVYQVNYRGYAQLDEGVNGKLKSTFSFQGSPLQSPFEKQMNGPLAEEYTVSVEAETKHQVWSTCGSPRAMIIDSELQVDNSAAPEAAGQLTMDSFDAELTHKYGIAWRKCENETRSQKYRSFTAALYQDVLGRTASEPEIDTWVTRLESGLKRTLMTMAFLGTEEYRTRLVKGYATKFLKRDIEATMLNAFVRSLARGARDEDVMVSMLASAEYYRLHGSSNRGFVVALYTDILGRAPESDRVVQGWIDQLRRQSRSQVAYSFVRSTEYRSMLLNSRYLSYLGRPADGPASKWWLLGLSAGLTQELVQSHLLGSDEYWARKTK